MPDVIDVTGLPSPVVDDLRRLVSTLRGRLADSAAGGAGGETSEEWAARLTDWVRSHANRAINLDDSREGVYEGRGE